MKVLSKLSINTAVYSNISNMKYDSPINDVGRGFIVEYHRTRTGPNFFMVFYKGCSRIVTEPIEVSRTLGSARYLDSSKVLRAWCEEMVEQYEKKAEEGMSKEEKVLEYAKTAGFGPEGHTDTADGVDETDPNYQTRMIT